ncbi:MAG: 23S rRNA (uracil(1939)-C(5))-methyltransferase RlmD [Acidobacteriota bacterium]
MTLSKGELVELEIHSAAYEGLAVARADGLVVFVQNAVPGDRVQARIVKKRKNHAEAVVEEVLQASQQRTEPRCKYFGVCGGCSWQNVAYEHQLIYKQQQVEETLQHLGGFKDLRVFPTLPSPDIYHYRNKMEFTFGPRRWLTRREIDSGQAFDDQLALGLHIPKRFDKILDLDECHLQSPLSVNILNKTREIAVLRKWAAYVTREHTGFARNLVIRTGCHTGQIMVNLVTSRSEPAEMRHFAQVLTASVPEITTVVNTIHPGRSPVAQDAEEIAYYGQGTLCERIGGLTFKIAPSTFFQPNTAQAERLYGVVKRLADLNGNETVYDLYCGVGAISLFLSDRARRLIGVEYQAEAVEDARQNAVANGISNCSFLAGDASEVLSEDFIAQNGRPDLVVVDPPRAGMHPNVCRALLRVAAPKIVYVSCNPATQARDLKMVSETYRITAVQPVDMFPQTYHIENVVALGRG